MTRRTLLTASLPFTAIASVNVRSAGAKGDGSVLETPSLQSAIDSCSTSGGGQVIFPAGRYLTGTLFLRDNVTLVLEEGATILGSPRLDDYPVVYDAFPSYTQNYTDRCLLRADSAANISIRGDGVIDGNGEAFAGPYKVRPYTLRFLACRNVRIQGITFRNSAMWVQHYLDCEDVLIDGITVRSRRKSVNNDGIDIDSCRRVRIANCDIDCGDDAIVLKATTAKPCQDVAVSNCILSTLCNAFKLGTESNGGFDNIVFSNSAIHNTRLAGIALEAVDGGPLARVSISNIVMRGVGCPIFVRLGDRARPVSTGDPRPGVSTLSGVTIRGVNATATSPVGCSITGLAKYPVEDILLDDVRLTMPGGANESAPGGAVPERPDAYPEFGMFGPLPSYGLYIRHARNIVLNRVSFALGKPDVRPAVVAEDAAGLTIANLRPAAVDGQEFAIALHDVRDAAISGTSWPGTVVQLSGRLSDRITVRGKHARPVDASSDVKSAAWESLP